MFVRAIPHDVGSKPMSVFSYPTIVADQVSDIFRGKPLALHPEADSVGKFSESTLHVPLSPAKFQLALTSVLDRIEAEIRASDLSIEGISVDIERVMADVDSTGFTSSNAAGNESKMIGGSSGLDSKFRVVQHRAYADLASAEHAAAVLFRTIGVRARIVAL